MSQVNTIPLGPGPQNVVCPSCRSQVRTNLRHEASTKTHVIALLLCLIFFPCVCVPYCTDSCRNANHYCPSCNAYIGTHSS